MMLRHGRGAVAHKMVAAAGADQFSLRCVPADWFDLLVYFREAHPTRVITGTP